jgi:hypothetical protein
MLVFDTLSDPPKIEGVIFINVVSSLARSLLHPSLSNFMEIFDVDVYVSVYVHMMYRERERTKKLHRPGLRFPAHY